MINIPTSQSIRFRPIPPAGYHLPTFDDTFDQIGGAPNGLLVPWVQYVGTADLKIQVVTPDDNETWPIMTIMYDGGSAPIIDPVITVLGQLKYTTFNIEMGEYFDKLCRLKVDHYSNTADPIFAYLSESFMPRIEDLPQWKLNWFNIDQMSLLDYSTGLVNELWVDADIDLQPDAGEVSVYKNQNKYTKLKETGFRVFSFQCQVPAYIAEEIGLAMQSDKFYINEVEFMVEKKPSKNRLSKSNLYQFEAELIQSTAIGINTHDVGFVFPV